MGCVGMGSGYCSLAALLLVATAAALDARSRPYTVDFRGAFDQNLYENVLDAELCDQQLRFLANHSLRLEFLDASAKIPSGILGGNVNDLGDYFQCLRISHLVDEMDIQGKYCAVIVPFEQEPIEWPEWPDLPDLPDLPDIIWPIPRPDNETISVMQHYLRLQKYAAAVTGTNEPVSSRIFPVAITAQLGATMGMCVPKVCSARQAIDFVQDLVPFVNVSYAEYFCRLPDDKPVSPADYTAIVIFSMIGLLLATSTAYDLSHLFWFKRDPAEANSLYRCFSVYTNTKRFLTFKSPAGALECVDGIRAISMMWVVVGHTYAFTLLGFIHNLRDILSWLTMFSSTWVNAAPITVDTFFLLSGVLAVYTTVGKISRGRFIRTIHLFYINRLLRMFPLLATAVLLQASLFNHVSDGPFWQNVAQATEHCRTWWWSALLHVQNYVNPLEVCLVQTWYLSVDVQLYLLCPLALVWLFGGALRAWLALAAVALLSLVSSSLYSFLNNFSAALANMERIGEFNDYVKVYYVNTLARAPPFVVGMMYGYMLHLWRDKKIRIPFIHAAILWLLSFAMMAFCIFSIYPVMQPEHEAQLFDNFLNAYMRAIWACGLGWLIFACVQGYGGPINWFLSLRMWKLPARLSFAMYLIHIPIIMAANGSWVKTHYFTNSETFYRFMSDLIFTFVAAFVLSIAIDAPFSTLQKLLMGGGGKKRPQKPKVEAPQAVVENFEKPYFENAAYVLETANDRFVKTQL